MFLSIAPATRFACLQELSEEIERAPVHEQFKFEGQDPIQYGSFDHFRDDLKFDENGRNYFYIDGWFDESLQRLDPEALKAFVRNLKAPFSDYETFLQFWGTTDLMCSGATFIRLLVFLDSARAADLGEPFTRLLKDSIADGSIRIEPFPTPVRPLKCRSVFEQRILVPTKGFESWKQFLKGADKHFVEGYSAMSAALAWEAAKNRPSGFPVSVENVISEERFTRQGIKLLLAQPERKTPLVGGGYPSHTDLFCLARNGLGELLSIAIEAKVDEPFGDYVADWIAAGESNSDGGANRRARLNFLCEVLGLDMEVAQLLRYQLLHRTVAPIIEAKEFNCQHAVMLVHSFSQQKPQTSFDDFKEFVGALLPGVEIEPNKVYGLTCEHAGIEVWIGWVQDDLPTRPKA